MPEEVFRPVGRVVREPELRDEVRGRDTLEGELEVVAEKTGDWATAPTTFKPSVAKAQQIQAALKDTLRAQLDAEADRLGDDPSIIAIHGRTGVSNAK
ncbi:MAG: hypothetical protein ACRDTH_18390 [Pseudonocardiaceae bacterium]